MSPYAFLQKPVRWLRAISEHAATSSGAPSFAYQLCLEQIREEQCAGLDLSGWRVAFCGAEPVRAATLRRFAERFARYGLGAAALFPCYGLAEATLFATGGPAGSGLRTHGDRIPAASCGRGGAGQRLAIVDAAGAPAAEGTTGEIWLAGPHVAQGYWRQPAETEKTFGARLAGDAAAWLRTGDLGFVREGELFVTGRLKDLIIVRGAKHHPEEIEATIAGSHPGFSGGGGAVFLLDEAGDPQLVALHEVGREALADATAMVRAAAAAVNAAHGFRPDTLLLLRAGSLPRTTSGKVQRHVAREDYLAGRFSPVVPRA